MSADAPDLQLVTGAGAFEVDVLVRRLASDRLEVSGHVSTAADVQEPVRHLRLALLDAHDRRLIAETRTDALGEFALPALDTDRYVLKLGETRDAPRVALGMGGGIDAHRQTGV